MTPDRCGQGSFQCVRSSLPLPLGEVARVSESERVLPGRLGRGKKRGPEKSAPTHLSYHTPVCKSTAKWPGSFKICGLHKNRCLHLGNIPS